MKKVMIMLIALFVSLSLVMPSFAQVNFTVSAQIPAATSASFAVSRVTPGPPEVFTPVATTNLNFGTLALNTTLGIFLPSFFWAVDVGSNGAGNPDVAFAYTDTANPNGALNSGDGLGKHGTIAYSKVVTNANGTQTVTLIRGESLAQASTSGGINETAIAGGFLRFNVGIATGNVNIQEGTATPFNTGDAPGVYSGTLTVTATFD